MSPQEKFQHNNLLPTDKSLHLILFITGLIFLYKIYFQNKKRLPPSPWGVPLLGHLPLLGNKPHIQIEKWSRHYGDIMMLRFGSRNVVVVSGLDSLKTCFLDKWRNFGSRPDFLVLRTVSGGKSILGREMTLGWKRLRKIMKGSINSVMKRHTSRPSFFEENVIRAAVEFCDDLINKDKDKLTKNTPENNTHDSFDPREILFDKMVRLLFSLCFGRADRSFDNLQEYKQVQKRIVKAFSGLHIQDIFPWLRHLYTPDTSNIMNDVDFQDKIVKDRQTIYLQNHDQHEKDCHSFMGNLMKHIHDNSEKSNLDSIITDDEIKNLSIEFIGAGLFTSNGWLSWFIYFMARYPDIQERAFTEISRNIANSDTVSSGDREHLPYTEAVLWESFRYATALPLLIPHAAETDTSIEGYDIPKGTVMFINAWALSRDQRLWTDPHEFIPERFLFKKETNNHHSNSSMVHENDNESHFNETNDFRIRRDKVEQLIPFSLGARRCVGEPIGKMQVFLFAATIVQRCKITMKKGLTENEEKESLGGETPYFEITVSERI